MKKSIKLGTRRVSIPSHLFLGMHFSRFVLFALSCVALVSAGLLRHGGSSQEQPVKNTWNTDEISQAAGLVQQTYCKKQEEGLRIGDSTLLESFGDGDKRQRVNIYHSDSLGIAVAIEGTNLLSITSDLHDVKAIPVNPHERYKSFMPQGVKLMWGFQEAYVDVMDDMVRAIEKYKKEKNEKRVTVIGHSLGAAMGLIATLDITNRVEGGLHKAYLFGLPRVGNAAFASFVDQKVGKRLHSIINGRDWVPTVPPRALGYQHPSNYLWIYPGNTTKAKIYPGQENVHGILTVPRDFNFNDHQGIYFHTQIGAIFGQCPAKINNFYE